MRRLLLTAVVLVLLCALPARADIITIEPDDFAAGTDLTHVGPGVTLSRATATRSTGTPIAFSPVYSVLDPTCAFQPCSATTGDQLFGAFGGSQHFSRCFDQVHGTAYPMPESGNQCANEAAHSVLMLEFDSGADFVEIGATWGSDFLVMFAYDELFNPILSTGVSGPGGSTTSYTPGDPYRRTIQSITSTTPMRYVLLGSTEGGINLDRLRYEAVPEPTMLTLLGVGLSFLGARVRRAR